MCQLPPEQGPCEAAINSWFYNPSSGRCEQLQFGGCDGNLNNFASRRECETACGGNETLQDKASRHFKLKSSNDFASFSVCFDEPRTCNTWYGFQRFVYNPTDDTCSRQRICPSFRNGNKFRQLSACEDRCGELYSLPVSRVSL